MKSRIADRLVDVAVTLLCWSYFIFGFLFFFSPFYAAAAFSSRSEYLFQQLNRKFYRGFFSFLKSLAPRQQWEIDPGISDIGASVVVCNHLSYLDPLLLISLLGRAKTIVKPVFFSVPIFGWILRKSGYFPAAATGPHAGIMLAQMETIGGYLSDGGNLFIFPQGTRSRDGQIGELSQGAFKIARYCNAPVYVVCIQNTGRLFTPGRFFFFATRPNRISVKIVDRILPGPAPLGLADLSVRIRRAMEGCMDGIIEEGKGEAYG